VTRACQAAIRGALLICLLSPAAPLLAQKATAKSADQKPPAAAPAPVPAADPVLEAMQAELARSRDQLQLEQMQRPYYIEYVVTDLDLYTAEAAFGAVRVEQRQRARLLRAVVRIGDYKQDSYFGAGQGSIDLMPIDGDVQALRHQLWLATDKAYKMAIEAFTRKQAALKQFESATTPSDDFSHEEPAFYEAPVQKLDFDAAKWRGLLESATALYRSDPDVQLLVAHAMFREQTRYLVNSEGTVLRRSEPLYAVNVQGETQAPDGMRLERSRSFVVGAAAELPSPEQYRAAAEQVVAQLAELRKAPLVDDEYHGPVLFSSDAAGNVFARLIAPSVAGRKPGPGTTSRTLGEYASSYKSRVLPDFISLVDDPTVSVFGGRTLLGSYQYDDEGVKARAVNVVQKGELVSYLLGRQPIRDFPSSNGHGRGPGMMAPMPHVGNLFVNVSTPQTFAAMRQKLIDICRDRGLPYGYYVKALGGAGLGLAPGILYRVWVNDGREELVRGAEFSQLDARALRNDLIAAGDDPKVDNHAEVVNYSVIAPSILMGELVIKPSAQAKDKLPQYPAPGTKVALQAPGTTSPGGAAQHP